MTEATLRTEGTACGTPEVALITVHWTCPFGPGRGREGERGTEKGRGRKGVKVEEEEKVMMGETSGREVNTGGKQSNYSHF